MKKTEIVEHCFGHVWLHFEWHTSIETLKRKRS